MRPPRSAFAVSNNWRVCGHGHLFAKAADFERQIDRGRLTDVQHEVVTHQLLEAGRLDGDAVLPWLQKRRCVFSAASVTVCVI
jgi:hypothetical protein